MNPLKEIGHNRSAGEPEDFDRLSMEARGWSLARWLGLGVLMGGCLALPLRLLAPPENIVNGALFPEEGSYVVTNGSITMVQTRNGEMEVRAPSFSRPDRTALAPGQVESPRFSGRGNGVPLPSDYVAAPAAANATHSPYGPGKVPLPSASGGGGQQEIDPRGGGRAVEEPEGNGLEPGALDPLERPSRVERRERSNGSVPYPNEAEWQPELPSRPEYRQPPQTSYPTPAQPPRPAAPAAAPSSNGPSQGFWVYYPKVEGWVYYEPSQEPVALNQTVAAAPPGYGAARANSYPEAHGVPGGTGYRGSDANPSGLNAEAVYSGAPGGSVLTSSQQQSAYESSLLAQNGAPRQSPPAAPPAIPVRPDQSMVDPSVSYPELKMSPVEPPDTPAQSPPPVAQPVDNAMALIRDKQYDLLVPRIMADSDAGLARALAWGLFKDKEYKAASEWFSQSLAWDESSHEAYYGLALSEFNLGNVRQAEAFARWQKDLYPGMKNLLGDILTERAMSAYENQDYKSAIASFEEVDSVVSGKMV